MTILADGFGGLNYTVLFIYMATIVSIGVYVSRRQKTTEDFFLAGRNMPWFVVAMSVFASLTSAISYMSTPGRAYKENVSMIAGYLILPLLAIFLIKTFFPFYHRLRVTTSYEYIGKRYGRPARYVVSGLFILARLGWLGIVIYAPALALSVATGMNIYLAIMLMGVLATLYTMLGGLTAVLWTDVVQFLILVGGGIWVSISLINAVPGGLGEIIQIARDSGRFDGFNWSFSFFKMSAIGSMIAYFLLVMQEYGTDQVTVQRLMAIGSFKGMAKSVLMSSFFDIFIFAMLMFMGLGLFAYYQNSPAQVADLKSDQILAYYIINSLPAGVSGLIVSAIFAAAMSSMDSGIHSLTTVIINDFVRPIRRKVVSDHADLNLARILVVTIGLTATIAAFWTGSFKHIAEAYGRIVGMFNGPILAIFLLGIFTRRAHFYAWLPGMIVGMVTTYCAGVFTELHWLYYFPLSMLTTLIVTYLMSFVIRRPLADRDLTLWRSRHE